MRKVVFFFVLALLVAIEEVTLALAPGVSTSIEEPQILRKWPQTDVRLLSHVRLTVPAFSQNDPRWRNNIMQTCNRTIGQAGCALTSTAMVFKYYGAVDKDPGKLNTCLGRNACPISWSIAARSCSENKASWIGSWTFSYNKLMSMLNAGRPPIVRLVRDNRVHFVVVTAGSGNTPGGYDINDPWDGMSKKLSSYTNAGWSLHSIREFAKR